MNKLTEYLKTAVEISLIIILHILKVEMCFEKYLKVSNLIM